MSRSPYSRLFCNQIADVMATFSIVAQALRTGEPTSEAFHINIMHYHGDVGHYSYSYTDFSHNDMHKHHFASVTKYEYMFYATAVASVLQVLEVSVCDSLVQWCIGANFADRTIHRA